MTSITGTPESRTETEVAPEAAEPTIFSQFIFFGLDPQWRRLPAAERAAHRREWQEAVAAPGIRTWAYSTVGLKAGVDLGLWRSAETVEALQEQSGRLNHTQLAGYLNPTHSLLGMTRPSQYVRRRSSQEQSLNSDERGRYLVIYPFTKTQEWYLLPQERRQELMTGHIRIGHRFREVRQSLLYSFGVDDQEFIVCYEMEELPVFQQLVHELRATEARLYTLNDTPIFTCLHQPLARALELLG